MNGIYEHPNTDMHSNTRVIIFVLPAHINVNSFTCGGYEKGGSRSEPQNVTSRRLAAGNGNSR